MADSKRIAGSAGLPGAGQEVIEAPPSRAKAVAPKGIRTTTDVKKVAFALAEDLLNGAIAPKVSGGIVSAMSVGLRTFQLEMRHAENLSPNGNGIDLIASPEAQDPVEERKRQLRKELAELEAASGKDVKIDTPAIAAAK
jgi:hypothetical protein